MGDAKLIYLMVHGAERGPFALEQVRTMFETGLVTPETMFKKAEEWQPLAEAISANRRPSESLGRYFVRISGEQRGPFIFEQLRAMWKAGQLSPEATCKWAEIWQPLARVLPIVVAAPLPG